MAESQVHIASVMKRDSARPNTVGLGSRELRDLLNSLDDAGGAERRRIFARWPFRSVAVPVTLDHPGGQRAELRMACRNISCGGVGLLHSAYVHIGSPCTVGVPRDGKTERLRGRVVRCQHVQRTVHEVGIEFNEPISVRDYIRVDARGWFAVEAVEEKSLDGTLIHVDADLKNRQALRAFIAKTNVAVRTAQSGEEGLKRAAKKASVIVCSTGLPDMRGDEFCARARAQGIFAPIILTAAVTDKAGRQQVLDSTAAGYLVEPLDREMLLRAVAECAVAPGRLEGASFERVAGSELIGVRTEPELGEPQRAAVKPRDNSDLVSVVRSAFPKDAADNARMLREAVETGEPIEVYAVCSQLRTTAPIVGQSAIALAATELADRLSEHMLIGPVQREIDALIALCERASAGEAA